MLQRIVVMEQHIILPIKAAWIAILLRPLYFSAWVGEAAKNLDVSPRSAYTFFWVYVGANLVAGILILLVRRIPPSARELTVFLMTLIDGIFLGVLTVVTGGYNSPLYWLFLGLIVRTAVSVPRATSQLLLNLTLSACFIIGGSDRLLCGTNLPERIGTCWSFTLRTIPPNRCCCDWCCCC